MKVILLFLILAASSCASHKTYVIRIYEGCFGDDTKDFGWEKEPVDHKGAYHIDHHGDTAIIHYNDLLGRGHQ